MKQLSLKKQKKKPVKKKKPNSATTSRSKKNKAASKENENSVSKTNAEKDTVSDKTVKDKMEKEETDKDKMGKDKAGKETEKEETDKDKTGKDKTGKDLTSGNKDSDDIVTVNFDDPSLHIDTHEDKLKCPTCLKIQKPQLFEYHIVACRKKREKQKAKKFVCIHDGCYKRFKYNRELQDHVRLHTGEFLSGVVPWGGGAKGEEVCVYT